MVDEGANDIAVKRGTVGFWLPTTQLRGRDCNRHPVIISSFDSFRMRFEAMAAAR